MITAALIYIPLFVVLTERVFKEQLLSGGALGAALVSAGVLHAWEVGHNVFKAW